MRDRRGELSSAPPAEGSPPTPAPGTRRGGEAARAGLGGGGGGHRKTPGRRAAPPAGGGGGSSPSSFPAQARQHLRIDGVARRLHAIHEPRPQARRGEAPLDAPVAVHPLAA